MSKKVVTLKTPIQYEGRRLPTTVEEYRKDYVIYLDSKFLTKAQKEALLASFDTGVAAALVLKHKRGKYGN